MAQYQRTADKEEIDGKFKFKLGSRMETLVCECKNRQGKLKTGLIQKSLESSLKLHKAKLNFIFCEDAVSRSTLTSNFSDFCRHNRIQVYRVVKVSKNEDSFEIKPFQPVVLSPSTSPKLTCVLFEYKYINYHATIKKIVRQSLSLPKRLIPSSAFSITKRLKS